MGKIKRIQADSEEPMADPASALISSEVSARSCDAQGNGRR
jgi:hypothetical protein